MKYCTRCGRELFDEAVVCPGCGVSTGLAFNPPSRYDGKSVAAFVLGIVSLVIFWIWLIGYPVSIVGIALAVTGIRGVRKPLAFPGFVMSIIGLSLTTLFFLIDILNALL